MARKRVGCHCPHTPHGTRIFVHPDCPIHGYSSPFPSEKYPWALTPDDVAHLHEMKIDPELHLPPFNPAIWQV